MKLDMDAVEQDDVLLIDKISRLWLLDHVPNQPICSDIQMSPVLGYGRFSEGKAEAERMLKSNQLAAGALPI